MPKEQYLEGKHPVGLESSPASDSNPELGIENNTVDWDGSDDSENPVNWPASKRWTQIIMISILGFIMYGLSPIAWSKHVIHHVC